MPSLCIFLRFLPCLRGEEQTSMNRRTFIASAAAAISAPAQTLPPAVEKLEPMTGGIQPITADERRARVEKARRLMRENKIGAIVCEGGASMFYFTGTRWPQGERLTAWVLPASGDPAWVVSESDRARLAPLVVMKAEVHAWKDDAEASKLVMDATGRAARIGMEE